ncbi:MAG TPA: cell division protein FtsA [Pyrinomonadaceae bacterium]|jgi:cell division protein FtsA|nr:cell division protein FtsA [Pyrinomonadaceae bacterium]
MSSEIQAVGLDIGTSRVRCVVGEPAAGGKMNIVGIGEAESKGLRRGVVTSTESVAEAVKNAVAEAERVSGLEIDAATVNLSGEHLQGENKNGVVAVAGPDKEITEEDVERAVDSACAMPLTPGWEIVARLPQEFIVDGQDGITEPVGMSGSRLEALVHVVTSPSAGRQNLVKAISKADIDVDQLVLEPVAAAASVLTDEDKEYGCAVVNMGSEITTLMIFGRGAVQHTAVFPFGSMLFTKDIATGLRVSIPEANKIKREHGCVAGFLLNEHERMEMIDIVPFGRNETRGLSKEILCDIMQPRAVELMQHVAKEVSTAKLQISGGVFLTGGGARVRGLAEIAEQVFDAPTRIGVPEKAHFGGLANEISGPEWATASGLALLSMKAEMREGSGRSRSSASRVAEWFGGLKEKFR